MDSKSVVNASIKMAISSREEEELLKKELKHQNIMVAAAEFGGNLLTSIPKIMERSVVASKRSGLIEECQAHEGAVAGATKEALMQVSPKALGLNVGGKIGIARSGVHISVTIYLSIGMLHLNEITIGLGHRTISEK
ncbi:HutP superfamily protein [Clostridium cylindrosporum DSM 605]|uniref:Hut operon positive regulatory protein n=2 Tax=Clostridium cylindrosporum TaxID=1495 RepID=A0A0J8G377_CLOCY|nr:HutP superfamily protein [Clostridium cylindrosporum DSM 605]